MIEENYLFVDDFNRVDGQEKIRKVVGIKERDKRVHFSLLNKESIIPLLHYFEENPSKLLETYSLTIDPHIEERGLEVREYNSSRMWSSSFNNYNMILLDSKETYSAHEIIIPFRKLLKKRKDYIKEKGLESYFGDDRRKLLIKEGTNFKIDNVMRSVEDKFGEDKEVVCEDIGASSNVYKPGIIFGLPVDNARMIGSRRILMNGDKATPLANLDERIHFVNVGVETLPPKEYNFNH